MYSSDEINMGILTRLRVKGVLLKDDVAMFHLVELIQKSMCFFYQLNRSLYQVKQ